MITTWILRVSRTAIALVVAAFALALAGCGAREVPSASRDACGIAEANRSLEWRKFRSRYPYHYQTLAISPAFPDGCRVLVIAEPPPRTTVEALTSQISLRLTSERKRIGHDGYVEDFVTVLPPGIAASAQAQQLASTLYGTAHKIYVTSTSEDPPPATALDIHPAPAELAQWLLKDAPEVIPVDGAARIPLRRVLDAGLPGVFFTAKTGLVLWSIPKYRDLESQRTWARQFALESDLILGSLASHNTLLVVARERHLPPDAFPPLRFETIKLLAAVDTPSLGQSFERGNFFAGRFDERRDWAPIYLSAALVDSEYGSLLNIADQVLKSWSQAGATRYENFAYPDPPSWPFPVPVSKFLHARELIFNWNTSGLGAFADLQDYRLYWVKQTGSLAVTYVPDGAENVRAEEAADHARQYFSSLDNPILARVVQYAALYQIFRDAGVIARDRPPTYDADAENNALYESAITALKQLGTASAQELSDHIIKDLRATGSADEENAMDAARSLVSARNELQRGLANGYSYSDLARGLVDTRHQLTLVRSKIDFGLPLSEEDEAALGSVDFARAMQPFAPAFRTLGGSLDEIKTKYEQTAAARPSGAIRTPSLIVSENTSVMGGGIGGHNIDSDAPSYRPGLLPLDDQISRLTEVRIGRTGFERGAALPPRDLSLALGARPGDPAERGLSPTLVLAETRPTPTLRQPASEVPDVLTITGGRHGYQISGLDGTVRRVSNPSQLSTAVAAELRKRGVALEVRLTGVPEDVALNVARTVDVQAGSSATIMTIGPSNAEVAPARAQVSLEQLREISGGLDLTLRVEAPGLSCRIRAHMTSLSAQIARLTGTAREHLVLSTAQETSKALGPSPIRVAQYALELKDTLEQLGDTSVVAELGDMLIGDLEPTQNVVVAGQ